MIYLNSYLEKKCHSKHSESYKKNLSQQNTLLKNMKNDTGDYQSGRTSWFGRFWKKRKEDITSNCMLGVFFGFDKVPYEFKL